MDGETDVHACRRGWIAVSNQLLKCTGSRKSRPRSALSLTASLVSLYEVLHSDFVVACQPLRGLTHASIARAIIAARTFSHGEKNLTHKNFSRLRTAGGFLIRKKIIKKIRKKQSIVIFFSILNIQKLEMPVWHSKSRTK